MKHRALVVTEGGGTKMGQLCPKPCSCLGRGQSVYSNRLAGKGSKLSEGGFKEAGEGRRKQGAKWKKQRQTGALKTRPKMSRHGSYAGNNTY